MQLVQDVSSMQLSHGNIHDLHVLLSS